MKDTEGEYSYTLRRLLTLIYLGIFISLSYNVRIMKRRQIIFASGAAVVIGLAGCSELNSLTGDDEGDSYGDTSTPESTIRSWFDLQTEFSSGDNFNDFLEDAETLVHSESNLLDDYNRDGVADRSYTIHEIEVTHRDLTREELEEPPFTRRVDLKGSVQNEDAIPDIVEENAWIEADITIRGRGEEIELTAHYLLTTEDGEWQIVG